MKKIMNRSLVTSFLIVGGLMLQKTGYAQKKEVPNYIFAENAKSVVVITSNLKFDKYVPTTWINGRETVDIKEYSSLDEGLWKAIIKMVETALNGININPSAVISLDQTELIKNRNLMYETFEKELSDVKPYYAISISFVDENRIKRRFQSQGKLIPSDLKKASFIISKTDGTEASSYYIMKMNGSLGGVISEFREDIESKPSSYFLKKIDEVEIEKSDQKAVEGSKEMKTLSSLGTIGKEYETYPNDITEKKILVVHHFITNTGHKGMDNAGKKSVEVMVDYLEKFYKGEYKLVSNFNYAKELKEGGYKYVLTTFKEHKVVTTTTITTDRMSPSSNNVSTKTDRDTKLVVEYFYVVKNIETNEVYYGPDKEKLEKKAVESMQHSIKVTLKAMVEHYGWEE